MLSIWPEYKGYAFPRLIASLYDTFGRLILTFTFVIVVDQLTNRVKEYFIVFQGQKTRLLDPSRWSLDG